MDITIENITPDLAAHYLTLNTHNRPLDKKRCGKLAAALQRGEWCMNGDAIRISRTGVLLDGQHRLMAVCMSKVPIDTVVIAGLPDDVFDTIDVEKKSRGAADVLAIRGEKNAAALGAIARLNFVYRKSGNAFNSNLDVSPTVKEIEKEIEKFPLLRTAAQAVCSRKWITKFVSQSIAGFCFFVFYQKNSTLCLEFFEKLETGTGLEQGSPILHLRERLTSNTSDKTQLHRVYKAALIFKAFRLYLDGAYVKVLRVRTEGDAPEANVFQL
jgi:hypothetical protein